MKLKDFSTKEKTVMSLVAVALGAAALIAMNIMSPGRSTPSEAETALAHPVASVIQLPTINSAAAAGSQTLNQVYPQLSAITAGLKVGPAASKAKAYVFFDTQCPHCAVLWDAAKPLLHDVEIVWVPVAFMNRASRSQGATILGATDPINAMGENESLVATGRSGISADSSAVNAYGAFIDRNTAVFNSFRGARDGVPYIVTKVNGEIRFTSGSMPTRELKQFLSLD